MVSGYPPDVDGIGDYTYFLAQAMAANSGVSKPVTVYTRTGKHFEAEHVRVVPFFELSRASSIRKLPMLVAQDKPDWVVLQYNPFCWGARGFCPAVPQTLRKIKALPIPPKIAVMFHETTVPRWPWRFGLMYLWQRPIFSGVVKAADAIFVSTKRWIPQVKAVGGRVPIEVSPAGSNVPRSRLSKQQARSRLGIAENTLVMAVFGGAHPSRQIDWIGETARQRHAFSADMLVLHVGPEGDAIGRTMGGLPFKSMGVCPAEEVGDILRSADCLLSPFVDGISTRRTSAMAGLVNGVPVATTAREWTDDMFVSADAEVLLASRATRPEKFAQEFLSWCKPATPVVSSKVQQWHDSAFTWSQIAKKMVVSLQRLAARS